MTEREREEAKRRGECLCVWLERSECSKPMTVCGSGHRISKKGETRGDLAYK